MGDGKEMSRDGVEVKEGWGKIFSEGGRDNKEEEKTIRIIKYSDLTGRVIETKKVIETKRGRNDEGKVVDKAMGIYELNMESNIEYQEEEEGKDVVKMDSGSGKNVTGDLDRLRNPRVPEVSISFKGFNNSKSTVGIVGTNVDGKQEFYVEDMPPNLTLLSAQAYAEGGAVVLFGNGGYVVKGEAGELEILEKAVKDMRVTKVLKVVRGTYEVVKETSWRKVIAEAYHITYFNGRNSKVNVSSSEDRILTYLLSGFSMGDLRQLVKSGGIKGMHPSITEESVKKFWKKNGSTLNIRAMALAKNQPNEAAFQKERGKIECPGSFEMDIMFWDELEARKPGEKMRRKLPSHGGATCMGLAVDIFSGFLIGKTLKSVKNPIEFVKFVVEKARSEKHVVSLVSADVGIKSVARLGRGKEVVGKYLVEQGIKMRTADAMNHSNGTAMIESCIGVVKEIMRFAYAYVMGNESVMKMKILTRRELLRLWGDIFHWALGVINNKPHRSRNGKTKFEMYYGWAPNIQENRMLPIFCLVMVHRKEGKEGRTTGHYQYGLYIGWSETVVGGIKVIVKTNGKLQCIVSSKFKCPSQGGGVDVRESENRGLRDIIEWSDEGEKEEKEEEENSEEEEDEEKNVERGEGEGEEAEKGIEKGGKGEDMVSGKEEEKGSRRETEIEGEMEIRTEGNKVEASLRGDEEGEEEVEREEEFIRVKSKKEKKGKMRLMNEEELREMRQRGKERRKEKGRSKLSSDLYESFLVDWTDVIEDDKNMAYFSFGDNCLIKLLDVPDKNENKEQYETYCAVAEIVAREESEKERKEGEVIEAYRVVTVNVPRSFREALTSKDWREAAIKEVTTISQEKVMVQMSVDAAKKAIEQGANVVVLFPIYEIKIKDGVEVRKIRLVGNGRPHVYDKKETYTAMPAREEVYMLWHIIATHDWDFYKADEIRAFLKAPKLGVKRVIARMRDDGRYWEVLQALYGLKTSPRDYDTSLGSRLKKLGFKPLMSSPCIFIQVIDTFIVIVFHWVDDFIITGNDPVRLKLFIEKFKLVFETLEPEIDPKEFLGVEISRNRTERIICISMEKKIEILAEKLGEVVKSGRVKRTPMAINAAVVNSEDLSNEMAVKLSEKDVSLYMEIVGSVIWISGVRGEIKFPVLYMTWFTKDPRVHHMRVAIHLVQYLWHSRKVVMVLGGKDRLGIVSCSDASFNKGKKGRSILGTMVKLNEKAGAVISKSTATQSTVLSSYEAELDGVSSGLKMMRQVENLLIELLEKDRDVPVHRNDNDGMINWVKGEGPGKGTKHMNLRLFYVRELMVSNQTDLLYIKREQLTADGLTKAKSRKEFVEFRHDLLGHELLRFMQGEEENEAMEDISEDED